MGSKSTLVSRRTSRRSRTGRDEIVYADVELDRIGQEQQALDSAGHYNHPDIFRLTVNERARPQVTWLRDSGALDTHPLSQSEAVSADLGTAD